MIGRVVEIAADGQHLGRDHGSMVVRKDGAEVGRVPLDDIAVLLCTARGTTYANGLLIELARRGVATVLCDEKYSPAAWLWPIEGHHIQALRMRQQLEASKPLQKRLWQAIVRAKVAGQWAMLERLDRPGHGLTALLRRLRSGDPDNIEAQAARIYWPRMFGSAFKRERYGEWPNAALNYGYTVLRSAVARAIVCAGLHPSIGIHHAHRGNAFCLADDLMEPYRPMVDGIVARLPSGGNQALDATTKRTLAGVLAVDMQTDEGTTPLLTCIERTAQSLAQSYETGKPSLRFPLKEAPPVLGPKAAEQT